MSNRLAVRSPALDPEIAAIYAGNVPRESERRANSSHSRGAENSPEKPPSNSPPRDPDIFGELEALKEIAEDNRSQYVDRKQFQDGSFDQVEHDISNTFRIGWRLLTR